MRERKHINPQWEARRRSQATPRNLAVLHTVIWLLCCTLRCLDHTVSLGGSDSV